MCDTLANLVQRKEWVSCLVLIYFTHLCIWSSALPARPLTVVSGKPHGAKTDKFFFEILVMLFLEVKK